MRRARTRWAGGPGLGRVSWDKVQGSGELASELSSWRWRKQPQGLVQDRPPHAQHSHHTLPSASPFSSVTLRSPAAVGPSPLRQHSLPSPLCQSKCPCAFRAWLTCRLHQEDFPDHTSTASLTPSERPEHSAMALVTPLPSVTPVAWWLSCSAFPSSSWEGQAHGQSSAAGHRTHV